MTADPLAFRLRAHGPHAPSTSVSGLDERLRIVPRIAPRVNRGRLAPNMPHLVTTGAAQREGFERGQLTVRPHHVVVGDCDRGEVTGM
jgi:hypothetical protein